MNMSRVLINPRLKHTQIAMTNLEMMHAAIERSLNAYEDNGRGLWRIDKLRGQHYLLIVSKAVPDLSVLSDQFGFKSVPGQTKNYQAFLDNLENGQIWQFKLTCNPTRADKNGIAFEKRGRVYSITKESEQIDWLIHKGEQYGFEVDPKTIIISNKLHYKFKKRDHAKSINFLSITFEGLLKITDVEKMRKALTEGIGREKAYGQGLITLMKP